VPPPADANRPVLLLDVMDTLVRDPFPTAVPAFFGLDLPGLLAAKHPRAWIEFELGTWDEATFLPRYFHDERPYDHAAFKRCLAQAYAWIEGMEPLLAELKQAGVAMHALSNYPPWYRLIEERLGLSRYLDWSFVSCETGVRKPEPSAYLGAAQALSRAPSECLFVDDRAKNCAAAEALGMPAHHFQTAAGLRRELVSRGVLSG